MALRRECNWCPEPHDLPSRPGDELEPDGVSHGICAVAEASMAAENHGLMRQMRTVVVPEPIYRGAMAVAREYDRLDGIPPGHPGTRWELVIWYLVGADIHGEPAEVAAEIKRRIGR